MRRITSRKRNNIIKYYLQGASIRNIAKEVGTSKNTVQTYINKYKSNEMPLLDFFPEEKLIQKTYAPASSQPTQGSYQPQVHHYYHFPQEQHQNTDQINNRREQEKERFFSYKSFAITSDRSVFLAFIHKKDKA